MALLGEPSGFSLCNEISVERIEVGNPWLALGAQELMYYLQQHLELLEYFQFLHRRAATTDFKYPFKKPSTGTESLNVKLFLKIAEVRYATYLRLLDRWARKPLEEWPLPPW
jgi:hypothetical protein